MRVDWTRICYYETPKLVRIRSVPLGIIQYALAAVFTTVFLIWMCLSGAYQEYQEVQSVLRIGLKGPATKALNSRNQPGLKRVWDIPDLILNPNEHDAFFVTTNLVVTSQTQSTCAEDPDVEGAQCRPDNAGQQCKEGESLLSGNGVMTGKCIAGQLNKTVCEVEAWCPVQPQSHPPPRRAILADAASRITVRIKNYISFPHFGPDYRMNNSMPSLKYQKTCFFDPVSDPHCSRFTIADIVRLAGRNFTQMAVKGGVIFVNIDWKTCNLDDGKIVDCRAEYSFNQPTEPERGFHFRRAEYYSDEKRTLYKTYGIRFLVHVRGRGGKTSVIKTILEIGAVFGVFGLSITILNVAILYVLPMCFSRLGAMKTWLENVSKRIYDEEAPPACSRCKRNCKCKLK